MNGVFEVLRAGHRIWRSPELGGKIYVCYEDKCFVLYTSSRFVVYKNHQLLFRHICNEFELCNEFEFQICLQLAILIKINTNKQTTPVKRQWFLNLLLNQSLTVYYSSQGLV